MLTGHIYLGRLADTFVQSILKPLIYYFDLFFYLSNDVVHPLNNRVQSQRHA